MQPQTAAVELLTEEKMTPSDERHTESEATLHATQKIYSLVELLSKGSSHKLLGLLTLDEAVYAHGVLALSAPQLKTFIEIDPDTIGSFPSRTRA